MAAGIKSHVRWNLAEGLRAVQQAEGRHTDVCEGPGYSDLQVAGGCPMQVGLDSVSHRVELGPAGGSSGEGVLIDHTRKCQLFKHGCRDSPSWDNCLRR